MSRIAPDERGPSRDADKTDSPAVADADRSWRRWAAMPLVLLVRAYQLLVSPMLLPSCRFYPSCSAYAVTALLRFGPVWGTWLTIRRLGRCHPWNPGGVDHVPRRGPGGRPLRENEGRPPPETAANAEDPGAAPHDGRHGN